MAEVLTGFSPFDSYVAFRQESTFGTPQGASADYTKFQISDGSAPPIVLPGFIDNSMKSRGSNIRDEADVFIQNLGQFTRYSVPQFVCPPDVAAHLLYGAVQTVSEAGTSPYLKTFTLDGSAFPDLSSNAGYFATLIVNNPGTSRGQRMRSFVVENLTFEWGNDQSGRCMATATLLSGKQVDNDGQYTGTNDFSAVIPPNKHNTNTALSIDGNDLTMNTFSVSVNSRWDWIGNAAGYADNYAYLGSEIVVNCNVKYDSNCQVLLENSTPSAISGLTFVTGNASSSVGHFGVTCNDAILLNHDLVRGGGQSIQSCNLEIELLRDGSASQNIVFTIADGIDQTW